MQKRKVAVNKLYISPREAYTNQVVELTDGTVTGWHPLTHEEPMTEWLGGTLVVTPLPNLRPQHISRISDFYPAGGHHPAPLSAYHIAHII